MGGLGSKGEPVEPGREGIPGAPGRRVEGKSQSIHCFCNIHTTQVLDVDLFPEIARVAPSLKES